LDAGSNQAPRSRRQFRDSDRPPTAQLTIGAIAVAHRRANAVGPVRLTCEPSGLRVDLLRVGRFVPGFAFAGLADARSFRVPYKAIRGMVREGSLLHLSLDPHSATPYNRFALARFSRDPLSSLMRVYRLRAVASAASYVFPVLLALLALSVVPASLAGGSIGQGATALVVALSSYRTLRWLVAWLTNGGPLSTRLRDSFEHRISVRLGLAPADELAGGPLGVPLPPRVYSDGPTPLRALGVNYRPRIFAAVGALALGAALMAVHVVQRFGVQAVVSLPVDDAVTGLSEPFSNAASKAYAVGVPNHPLCQCERVDSTLWRDGMPQLSIMITPIEGEVETLWLSFGEHYKVPFAPGARRRIEFDLAAVNNSNFDLDTIDMVVTFARRDAQNKRRAFIERGLHWPAKLRPGEAVKWRVKASGRTEFKVDSRLDARLGVGGVTVSSASTFFALQHARLPIVRLHGGMMLSYLRDPRAEAQVKAVTGLSPRLEQARARILETLVPLEVCDAVRTPKGVDMCVFNGTDELLRAVTVTELGKAQGKRHELRDLFMPGHGLRYTLDVSAGRHVQRFRVEPLYQ
jgi:hypothetical protein